MPLRRTLPIALIATGAFAWGAVSFGADREGGGAQSIAPAPLRALLQDPGGQAEPLPAFLANQVGRWQMEFEVNFGEDEPFRATGTTESRLACGGRWVVSDMSADMMGMRYEAVSIQGYDPQRKVFVGTHVDMSNTSIDVWEGKLDESGKRVVARMEGQHPIQMGKRAKLKGVTEMVSKDHFTYEEFLKGENGAWVRWLAVTQKRAQN